MVSSYESKPLGTADAWGRANTNSHGTQDPGHWAAACFPASSSTQTSLLHTAHYWTRSYLQCLENTGYPHAIKPLLKLFLRPKIPLHPGLAKSSNSRPFTSPPQEMRAATTPGTQQKLRAVSRRPSRPSLNLVPHALLLVSLKSQNPLLLSIFTAAYETNLFLCFYSSLSLDTSPEGAKLPLIRGW